MFREKSPYENELKKKRDDSFRKDHESVDITFRERTPEERARMRMCITQVVGDIPEGELFKEDRLTKYPKWFIDPRLEVRESPGKGLGVFANAPIKEHELIESCPVIICSAATFSWLSEEFCDASESFSRHILSDYPFNWAPSGSRCHSEAAFALGWGGIYNHSSYDPNIFWRCNFDLPSLEFWTKRDVEAGEEICSRYCPVGGLDNLWFEADDHPDQGRIEMVQGRQFIGHMGSWDELQKK